MTPLDDLMQTALHDSDLRCRRAAACELARQPAKNLTSLLGCFAEVLRHPDSLVQRRALQLLGALGVGAAPCLPHLLEALVSPRWTVREASAQALGRVGAGHAPTRSALVRCVLHDRTPLVRAAAAEALTHLTEDIPAAVTDLREALRHPFPRVRCRALRGLVQLSAAVPHLSALLSDALGDSHARVRRDAAGLLGGMGREAAPALPALLRRRYDRDQAVRRAAESSWTLLRQALPAALPALWDSFGASEEEPEQVLLRVLGRRDLPPRVRREFLAVCGRRAAWHHRRGKVEQTTVPDPLGTTEEVVTRPLVAAECAAVAHPTPRRSANQVRTIARREEAAWMLAWLWRELQRVDLAGGGPEPGKAP